MLFAAHIARDSTQTRPLVRALHAALVDMFTPAFWWFKAWLLLESTIFSMSVTLFVSSTLRLCAGLAVSSLGLLMAVLYKQYKNRIEEYTDWIARAGSVIALAIGLLLQHDLANKTAANVILVATSAFVALWFVDVLFMSGLVRKTINLFRQQQRLVREREQQDRQVQHPVPP